VSVIETVLSKESVAKPNIGGQSNLGTDWPGQYRRLGKALAEKLEVDLLRNNWEIK